MAAQEILPGVYSVGAVDWNVRNFHGHTYTTSRGTSYNAYLIVDEKVALVDTVLGSFAEELIANIRQVVPLEKIDYIIANHVETDHSGALPQLLKLAPQAKVIGTQKCKEGLYKNYFLKMDFQAVKTGSSLDLGKRELKFIEAPMVHWPDSMFTYCPQDALLLPNDAFGQHLASSLRFDDEVDQCALMDEAAKYYANILWPLGPIIAKKIAEVQAMHIPLKVIAPSHGIIWRKDPGRIISAYLRWAQNTTQQKIVVAYETMWGATAEMAQKICAGITQVGVSFKLFDVAVSDRTEIIKEMLEAKGFLIGSSTHDNWMLPNLAGLLEFLKGLTPKNRLAAAFGSFGWAGGAVKEMEGILQQAGITLAQPGIGIKYRPEGQEAKACVEFGKNFAQKIKGETNG